MSVPQKYMFDNAFDKENEAPDPLVELKKKFDQKVQTAKKEAFEKGRLAGNQEALESIENQTKDALVALVAQNEELNNSYQESLKKIELESVEFGITAGTKLAGDLMRREPIDLLETFFKDAFKIIKGVPEITAHIHSSVSESINNTYQKWMDETGYTGKISFITNEDFAPTDVSINWNEGGIQRSVDDLMNAINNSMTNYFNAREQNTISNQPIIDQQINQIEQELTINNSEGPS